MPDRCTICDRTEAECHAFAAVLAFRPTTREEREDCQDHRPDWRAEALRLRAAWAWLAKHPGWYVQWGAGVRDGRKVVGWYIERFGQNTMETLVDLRRPSPLEAVIAAMEHEAAQATKEKADV